MNKARYAVIVTLVSLFPATAFSAGNAIEGQAKSTTCHSCHGATGISTQAIYPNLGGQQQDYLEKALYDYRSGSRNNAIMNSFAGNLSDQDIEDITAWYASQPGLSEMSE